MCQSYIIVLMVHVTIMVLNVSTGENVLHMAIVNEDPAMVKFLLDNGANYHERCNGKFFTPDDQKASRQDSLKHEWTDVCLKTNYDGWVLGATSKCQCLIKN